MPKRREIKSERDYYKLREYQQKAKEIISQNDYDGLKKLVKNSENQLTWPFVMSESMQPANDKLLDKIIAKYKSIIEKLAQKEGTMITNEINSDFEQDSVYDCVLILNDERIWEKMHSNFELNCIDDKHNNILIKAINDQRLDKNPSLLKNILEINKDFLKQTNIYGNNPLMHFVATTNINEKNKDIKTQTLDNLLSYYDYKDLIAIKNIQNKSALDLAQEQKDKTLIEKLQRHFNTKLELENSNNSDEALENQNSYNNSF